MKLSFRKLQFPKGFKSATVRTPRFLKKQIRAFKLLLLQPRLPFRGHSRLQQYIAKQVWPRDRTTFSLQTFGVVPTQTKTILSISGFMNHSKLNFKDGKNSCLAEIEVNSPFCAFDGDSINFAPSRRKVSSRAASSAFVRQSLVFFVIIHASNLNLFFWKPEKIFAAAVSSDCLPKKNLLFEAKTKWQP